MDDTDVETVGSPPTLVDRPPKREPTGSIDTALSQPQLAKASLAPSATVSIASPSEALQRDEVLRTRNFCYMAFVLGLGAASAVPFLRAGYYETRLFLGALTVGLLGIAYILYRTRDPASYWASKSVPAAWMVCGVTVTTALPYFGAYSPVPLLMLVGIYFFGLGQIRSVAFFAYGSASLMQAVCAALPILGIADPGIYKASYLSLEAQLFTQGLVLLVYTSAFYIARVSRRASITALGELQSAIRAVAQREALLQEARDELRRALGNGRGRFTEQVIDHYRLGGLIGRGAMGEVYEGVDTRDAQPVAVKMLSQASLGNTEHVKRFLRELRTASSIQSPNVVRVLAIGEEPLPHLVMERLHGRDLSSILRETRVLAPDKVIDVLQQVGAGITAAGAAGVIHRDLKPQNIFLAGDTWKILDFGVSRATDHGDTLTAGHLVGTPAYMAPEQARGARVDHRADLYALAAIAYRCLTGHALFSGGDIADVLYRVVHTQPRRPSSIASLPRDVDLALAIGLAKNPDDRYATAAELTSAITAALDNKLTEPWRSRARALEAWSR